MAAKQATAPTIDPMLSLDDLAALLTVSRRSTERMLSGGKLPPHAMTVGRMRRWETATVRAWIADQSAQGKGA